MTTLADCVTLPLPRIHDHRGDLTFVESGQHIPFDIRRIYYLYNVPGGTTRGGHAHYSLHQYIIAINGSFDMVMDDGRQRMRWHLNSPHQALYIPPMIQPYRDAAEPGFPACPPIHFSNTPWTCPPPSPS